MIVAVDGTPHVGSGIDLRECAVGAEAVRAAVCGTEGAGQRGGGCGRIAVECADPGPAYEHVGIVRPGMGFRRRAALTAAARSRGLAAPQDERLRRIRERLRELDEPDAAGATVADARRTLETVEGEIERLREEVAALRGRVRAREDADRDTDAAMASFQEAAGSLAAAETRRVAARQALERRRRELRTLRDRHERRLRLEDRAANQERAARRHLVAAIEGRFADALAAMPEHDPGTDADSVPPRATALATARIAAIRAPVVLDLADCGRFTSVQAAARWLDAPVVRV